MSNPYKLRGTKQPISFGVEKLDGYIVDATAPLPGDSFKIGDSFEFIVKSVKKSRARKDVEKWDLEGTYYPEVPMKEIG